MTQQPPAGEPEDTLSTFAAALRALIDERRISQAELARRLGVSAQSVSAWVMGNSTPSVDHAVGLEDALDADPGTLLRLAGYAIDNGATEPTIESLIWAHPCIDPEEKPVLVFLVRRAIERHETAHRD